MNGILRINKPDGWTSQDVDTKIKHFLHEKKVGHLGTLDPHATGVLPVLIGQATKCASFVLDEEKTYQVTFLLGRETDTEDIYGNLIRETEVSVSEEEVIKAVLSFSGITYGQVPPMYSAKKQNGKKLYDLAREGISVERPKVPVTIREISITDISLPHVSALVTCSKGTYIRTLCTDIAKKLSLPAVMERLTRTRHGSFLLSDCIELSDLLNFSEEKIKEVLVPLDRVFSAYPMLKTSEAGDFYLRNGNILYPHNFDSISLTSDGRCRIYLSTGEFKALYEKKGEAFHPLRIF